MPEWLIEVIAYGGLFIAAWVVLRIVNGGDGGSFNNDSAF